MRACQAALSILRRLKTHRVNSLEAAHGVRPRLRIGLNTGPAVVGTVQNRTTHCYGSRRHCQCCGAHPGIGGTEFRVHERGDASPGSRVGRSKICGRTSDQGQVRAAKGLSARGHRPQRTSRFDAALSRGLTPYVGRDREVETFEATPRTNRGLAFR